ncbi:hypothetical protein QTG54_009998 [Skeletonema marinoi]|uniref:Uncharacterized protein n=1 Tax=Skeletonema marinoi TaxID=267567 RepID=A0AAD9DB87_9STRA|nr:hypothetical protein QTG54_009998 [Skeletonema marinoi]
MGTCTGSSFINNLHNNFHELHKVIMKLSPAAPLFGAAVAAFFPGASASASADKTFKLCLMPTAFGAGISDAHDDALMLGTTPDEESSFIDMINCSRKTICEYDYRTCQILDEQCQGVCVWVGTKQDGYCTGGSSRSCKSILDIDSCHNDGCVWSNNACRNPSPTFTCSDYNGSGKCVRKGCAWDWNDGVCRNTSPSIFNCSKYDGTSSKNCLSKGCVWDGNTRTCNANTNVDATLLRT